MQMKKHFLACLLAYTYLRADAARILVDAAPNNQLSPLDTEMVLDKKWWSTALTTFCCQPTWWWWAALFRAWRLARTNAPEICVCAVITTLCSCYHPWLEHSAVSWQRTPQHCEAALHCLRKLANNGVHSLKFFTWPQLCFNPVSFVQVACAKIKQNSYSFFCKFVLGNISLGKGYM